MLFGFIAAVVLAVGPPIAFLAMPAAGMFLFVVPIWSVGVVCLLFVGFLIFGRIPAAIGVALPAFAMLAIAAPLLPPGALSKGPAGSVGEQVNVDDFIERELKEKCATGYVSLKKPSAKYGLLVLDGIDTRGEQNYDVADAVAVLTGMRVIQISRVGTDRHFHEGWETTAERSSSCAGARDSAKVGISPRGSQRSIAPLAVDACLRRIKIPDPSREQTPAIVVRSTGGAVHCEATELVERAASGDVKLGRVHYDSYHDRLYPNLKAPKGIPNNNRLLVLLSEVLQQDLSDAALMRHAVETTK